MTSPTPNSASVPSADGGSVAIVTAIDLSIGNARTVMNPTTLTSHPVMTESSEGPRHWLNPALHWLENERETLPLATYREIVPALGRVVLRLVDGKSVSEGGIVFPFGSQENTSVGVVETVCAKYESAEDDEDRTANGPLYSVGDVVIISKYTGTELTIDRKKRVICYESDILGRLLATPSVPPAAGVSMHPDPLQR